MNNNILIILLILIIIIICIYSQNKIEFFNVTNNLPSYDIFIIAGQSNSVGYGTRNKNYHLYGSLKNYIDDIPQNNIQMYLNNGNIINAVHPVDHLSNFISKKYKSPIINGGKSSNNSNYVGFGLTFAKKYIDSQNKTNSKVLLVGCGYGGTGFLQPRSDIPYWWNPTDNLNYTFSDNKKGVVKSLYLMTKQKITEMRTKVGSNSRVVGILWHQGERDNNECAKNSTNKNEYIFRINRLFRDLRNDIKNLFPNSTNVPILLGGLSPELVRRRKDHQFRPDYNQDKDMTYFIQNSVVPSIPNAHFVSSSPIPNSPFNTYLEGDNELDANGNPYKDNSGRIIKENTGSIHLYNHMVTFTYTTYHIPYTRIPTVS
jgi:hypothetical protein